MELSGTDHAFISGGASGIGLAIGDALARRGVRVTLADVDADSLALVVAARGEGFQGVPLDVRDRDQWLAAKAQAEARFGPVTIAVNNAGIAPDGRLFADPLPESFERIIGINLMGVYNGVITFAPQLREAGRGHILNVASMAGLTVPHPGTGAYVTAKFGVVGLSETLRRGRNQFAGHHRPDHRDHPRRWPNAARPQPRGRGRDGGARDRAQRHVCADPFRSHRTGDRAARRAGCRLCQGA